MNPSILRIGSRIPRILRPLPPLRTLHESSALKPKPTPKPLEEGEEVDTTRDTHENTLSSNDHRTAYDKGSFDPKITEPGLERDAVGKEHEFDHSNNPLDTSPANREVSRQRPETEDRAEGSPKDRKHSAQGHPKKGKAVPTTPGEGTKTWSRWLG